MQYNSILCVSFIGLKSKQKLKRARVSIELQEARAFLPLFACKKVMQK